MSYIVRKKISNEEFQKMVGNISMMKIAVDVEKKVIVMDCDYHIDCAQELYRHGSQRKDVWGANIYPKERRFDYEALLNIRPEDNNRSMDIQSIEIKKNIAAIIKEFLPL